MLEKWLGPFGLSSFRPGQREVIEAVLANRDTLCIMPTGGGKSLCYQLPALARAGVTLVVSPLIALMKDQVDTLTQRGISATFINSSLSPGEQQDRMGRMMAGEFKLVYIAPERLRHAAFLRAVSRIEVGLLAIDEAHCISQWGHDFRPDYARLGRFRQRIGNPQTIGLTATATETVRADIQQVLELRDPAVFITGFARSNLSFRVEAPKANSEKDRRVIEFLKGKPGAGIIYASTRKSCEHLVELLTKELKKAPEFYHAGMAHAERHRVQENFMTGKTPIVVATNAFGMGIDKPDLRFVLHYNIPGSLEAYYQEAGRAGRDGKQSVCLLLYSFQDRFIQEFFIENSYPSREMVQQVYEHLQSFERDPIEITLQELKDQLRLSIGTEGVANCERLLEKAGAIERLDSTQNMAAVRIDSDLPTLVELLPRDKKSQRAVLRGLERIVGPLRGERVLFSPKALADSLEMTWEAIARGIRNLVEHKLIDYVPPFRGRAIHLKNRELQFSQIQIDFAELERRKKAEFARLDRMISYATTHRCRQLEILEYFGDPNRQSCQRCDRCGAPWPQLDDSNASAPEKGDSELSETLTSDERDHRQAPLLYAVQVALSGVIRSRGRYGKKLIGKMLFGSDTKAVKSTGLHKLSTFGMLKPLKQSEIDLLIDRLIGVGMIQQVEETRFRPTIQITERGQQTLTGNLAMDWQTVFGAVLSQRLQAVFRNRQPKVSGNKSQEKPETKPEVIPQAHSTFGATSASSETLVTSDSGSIPSSSGDLSFRKEGDVADSPPDWEGREQETVSATDKFDPRDGVDSLWGPRSAAYWTCRLFAEGYLLDEIAEIRNLSQETVRDHLQQAATEPFRSFVAGNHDGDI